jgi:hypothetical protein
MPWQQSGPEASSDPAAGKGLTGALPWNAQASDPRSTDSHELLNWLDERETEEDSIPDFSLDSAPEAISSDAPPSYATSPDDTPDWLSGFAEDEPEAPAQSYPAYQEADAPPPPVAYAASIDDTPDWLSGFAEDTHADAAEIDEFPDWLNEDDTAAALNWMDEAPPDESLAGTTYQAVQTEAPYFPEAEIPPTDTPPTEAEPQSYEEWARLNAMEDEAGANDDSSLNWMSEDPAADLTYEDWEHQQAQAQREPDIALPDDFDLLPDLPEDELLPPTDGPLPTASGDFMPDWFLGVEALDDSEVPDWAKASLGKPASAPLPPPPPRATDDLLLPDLDLIAPADDFPPLPPEDLPGTGGIRRVAPAEAGLAFDDLFPDEDDSPAEDLPLPNTGELRLFSESTPSPAAIPLPNTGELPPLDDLALETGDEPDWLRGYSPEIPAAPAPSLDLGDDKRPSQTDFLPDWMSEIQAEDLPDAGPGLGAEDDFSLDDLPEIDPDSRPAAPAYDPYDLDSLLGTSAEPLTLGRSSDAPSPALGGSDQLFDDDFLRGFAQSTPPGPEIDLEAPEGAPALEGDDAYLYESEELPDWMRQIRPSGEAVTLAVGGLEGRFEQIPEQILPPELRNLREDSSQYLQASPPASVIQEGPMAGVEGALPILPALITPTELLLYKQARVDPRQRGRLEAVQGVIERLKAELAAQKIDIRYDLEADSPEEAEAQLSSLALPKAQKRARQREYGRLGLSLLLLLVVILPFLFEPLQVANDPPSTLTEDAAPIGAAVEALEAPRAIAWEADYVLVAFEYGSTAAQELDPLAEAVLRDIFAHYGVPVVVSTHPMGMLHAQNLLSRLAQDPLLRANLRKDPQYIILPYLSGGAVAVRALGGDSSANAIFLSQDIEGQATGLAGGDFAFVLVIGESYEDVRIWAEHLSDSDLAKYMLSTRAVEAMARPYLRAGSYQGLLSGYEGALSYEAARNPGLTRPWEDQGGLADPRLSRWHSSAWGAFLVVFVVIFGLTRKLIGDILTARRPKR